MKFGFEHPLYALLALSGLLLLAIYLWQRRSGRRIVPALFLWDSPAAPVQSGSRFAWRRLPLSFYLELLALLALAGAAVSPFLFSGKEMAPLVVVLDNSFSMRALTRNGQSVRDVLLNELRSQLRDDSGRRLIFMLAGRTPLLLEDRETRVDRDFLDQVWSTDEPAADLTGTLARGRLLFPGAEFRVLTDGEPAFPLPEDTGWYAAGSPLTNVGWINARRRSGRILLEAVNFSDTPRKIRMELTPGNRIEELDFAAGERKRMTFQLRENSLPVTARLSATGDPLTFDDVVTLLPEERPPLRVTLQSGLPEPAVRSIETLLVSGGGMVRAGEPELLIASAAALPAGKFHRLIWHAPEAGKAQFNTEMIVLRPDSDFTRGLELSGLRWAAGPEIRLPGRPLLRRGDTTLLSEVRRTDGYADLHLNLSVEHSNLLRHPFWPAFFWNVADSLRRERPGPEHRNYRSGDTVRIKAADPAAEKLELTLPDGSSRELAVIRQYAYLADPVAGLYRVKSAGTEWEFRVVSFSAAESDLTGRGVFRKQGIPPETGERSRKRIGWILLALAALILVIHQEIYGRKRGDA